MDTGHLQDAAEGTAPAPLSSDEKEDRRQILRNRAAQEPLNPFEWEGAEGATSRAPSPKGRRD